MPKTPRVFFSIFGGTGITNDFAQFGSKAASTPLKTKDPAVIQALPAWGNGLKDAILSGTKRPFLEDLNSVFFELAYQLFDLFEMGIAEWEVNTTYWIGSIVRKPGTDQLYSSKVDNNTSNSLPDQQDDNNWRFLGANLVGYRRPVLQWHANNSVDVEAQTGTANKTSIMFPDGSLRSVTEDLSSTQKYRRFDKTKTANWTSGTESGGLRSGVSAVTGRLYPIYAVKSQVDVTKFVLVGDDTEPVAANFATLNGRYGTSAWIYLGMIAMQDFGFGDGIQIMNFKQWGSKTWMMNINITLPGPVVIGTDCSLPLAGSTIPNTEAETLVWTSARGLAFGSGQMPLAVGGMTLRLMVEHNVPGAATQYWGPIMVLNGDVNSRSYTWCPPLGVGDITTGVQFEHVPDEKIQIAHTRAGNWPETGAFFNLLVRGWDDAVLAEGINNPL